MARLKLREVIQDRNGVALENATVYLYNQDTTTPISATLYADKTGVTTKSNPLTSDANGVVECYADLAAVTRVDLLVHPVSGSDITLADRAFEPDGGDLVLTSTNQTIAGVKTFSSGPIMTGATGSATSLALTTPVTSGGSSNAETLTAPVLIGRQYRGPKTWTLGCLGDVALGVDATAQVQAVIDEVLGYQLVAANQESGYEIIAERPYYSVSNIKVHGLLSSRITSRAGSAGTKFIGNQQSSSLPIFEFIGTRSLNVEGINAVAVLAHQSGSPPSVEPQCAFLITASAATADSTQNKFVDCGSWGHFTKAALALYSTSDNIFRDSSFVTYPAATHAIFVGRTNVLSFTSSLGALVASDGTGSGNQLFDQCQGHVTPEAAGLTPSTAAGSALYVYGSLGVNWDGGNLATYSRALVQLGGDARNLIFTRPQLYTDSETNKPLYGIYLEDDAAIRTLIFNGPQFNNSPIASGSPAIFAFADDVTIRDLYYLGPVYESSPGAVPIFRVVGAYASGATNAVDGGIIDCGGLTLAMSPAGQGPSISALTQLNNPGAITMDSGATDNSTKRTTSGMIIPGTVTAGGVTTSVIAGSSLTTSGTVGAGTTVTAGTSITATTSVTATTDLIGKHLKGSGSAPTASAGASWGTSRSVSVVGTDMACRVRVASAGTGQLNDSATTVTLTFNTAYANTPLWQLSMRVVDDLGIEGAIFRVISESTTAITVQVVFAGAEVPNAGNSYDFVFTMVDR